MEIIPHMVGEIKIAEVISDGLIIQQQGDGTDLMGNVYYEGYDRIILHQENITEDFFDLKNGMAGEILQKFSTYRVRLAIVGNFSHYNKKSLQDFIFESNKGRQVNFLPSVDEAVKKLSL